MLGLLIASPELVEALGALYRADAVGTRERLAAIGARVAEGHEAALAALETARAEVPEDVVVASVASYTTREPSSFASVTTPPSWFGFVVESSAPGGTASSKSPRSTLKRIVVPARALHRAKAGRWRHRTGDADRWRSPRARGRMNPSRGHALSPPRRVHRGPAVGNHHRDGGARRHGR